MGFSKFFIDRPIFATVISLVLLIVGILSYFQLPVEPYPQVAPPTIQVSAAYPGASAETVAATVATPIEQEINGVEGMLYMSSQSTADGRLTITITFELGTDLDQAQVLVQNRVAIAEPRLPEEVRRLGVTTSKNSPDLMLVINLFSNDGRYDQTYIGNYAVLRIRDQIRRIDGVGSIMLFGAAEYAMRVWLNPDLLQSFNITAGDVIAAIREQNVQVASGILNQAPQARQHYYEYSVQTQGRLVDPKQFENIIVKSGAGGRIVRLKDIARVELGAKSYVTRGYLGKRPAIALPIFQRPGSNALTTSDEIVGTMEALKRDFPPGIDYEIVYNPTEFIRESIDKVEMSVYQAAALVILVIILFLQSLRASFIPIIAIPVSLVGTFAVMAAFGLSLNNLTLFGLVLAIGIVVDDAIVVVENVQRNLGLKKGGRDASRLTMDEVGSALIATTLVLVAVFIPTLFLGGISGRFYQQFGITIAAATVISTLVSLTLSPALAAMAMERPKVARGFFAWFNRGLDAFGKGYLQVLALMIRRPVWVLALFLLFGAGLYIQLRWIPTGFIPPQDQGYFIISIQLPPGASLEATDAVVKRTVEKMLEVEGVEHSVAFTGFSGATFTNASNAAVIFPVLASFDSRRKMGRSYQDILNDMRFKGFSEKEAFIVVIPPPPVRGVGSLGGFRFMVQDREGRGLKHLEASTLALGQAANEAPATTSAFTFFETGTPQLYLDIDREKVQRLNVPVRDVFEALETYLGSVFVNDFNYLGRSFQVVMQADAPYRLTPDDALRIRVRSKNGGSVPLGSVAGLEEISGPSRVLRYNLYQSAALLGDTSPGYSTGEALDTMESLAAKILPDGFAYEWTDLAYQQKKTGNTAQLAFILAVVFVFLVLAAQYESWMLPFSIILIVPMGLFSALAGLWLFGMDNNILCQIGFVVLIALASKNAILIVEFARDLEKRSAMGPVDAAIESASIRLRPILMTSFSFILGVLPLVFASGAGAEMRRAIGTTVFSGMVGVTFFGLILTPVYYVLCRKLSLFLERQVKEPMS